ncbi:hypothetical protein [Maridesulfovibrio hydrothermalis]|uniref:Uncharacterized protein n=1 Tax=Maridesulfovibrio hydrothermalis AM13 = DSM 14728 TaxID=1121451 RepID=L0REB2_9BACT|nr:hypothetical protein [Maridesulfovibrio hydrothermalis]CCO25099.1 conserved protein of unknown function [Maridesulfovibrio hydrothermalis AM13 = DSM 14728]
MASGLAAYGMNAVVGMVGNIGMGAVSRGMSGEGTSWGNIGSDAFGGALGGMGGGGMSGGGLSSMSSLMSSIVGGGGSSASSSGSLLGGLGGSGSGGMGLMSQFGQSIFSNSQDIGDAQYNSQMSELHNYAAMEQGVHNRSVSYKEAQIVNQQAALRLAALRRGLYRRNHSISGHKGVRLDSGSVVDVREDLIKQADYDAEIVKYQAEVDSGRLIERGDMSVWSARSRSVLNSNAAYKKEQQVNAGANGSMINAGMSLFSSAMGSFSPGRSGSSSLIS